MPFSFALINTKATFGDYNFLKQNYRTLVVWVKHQFSFYLINNYVCEYESSAIA